MLEFPPLFWSLYHVWLFWLFIQWTIFHCFAHSLCLMLWLSMPILLPLISSKAWGYMCILLIHCVSRFYAYIAYIPLQSLCSFCISVHVYTYCPLMYVYASSAYTFMYVYTPSAWSLSMFMFVCSPSACSLTIVFAPYVWFLSMYIYNHATWWLPLY